MALSPYSLPFGLRQVKLTPLDAAGTLLSGSAQFLPASRTFSFGDAEDFETLEGDDVTIASHGSGPTVDWDLEGGGISLEVWKILSGGGIVAAGTSPTASKTYSKLTTDQRPYFQVEGRSISDSGGDFRTIVYRCKADGDLEFEMSNGSFALTKASGTGFGNLTDGKLYDFIMNETAIAVNLANKGAAAPGLAFYPEPTVTASDAPNAAKLAGLGYVALPTSAWTTGQKITVGGFDFNWSGTAWAAGAHA